MSDPPLITRLASKAQGVSAKQTAVAQTADAQALALQTAGTQTPAGHAPPTQAQAHKPSTLSIWTLIRRFFVPAPLVSLIGFVRWRARISSRAEVELSTNLQLGRRTTVSSFSKIKTSDGVLRTGTDCGFANGCFIAPGAGGIELGNHVMCGPSVAIIAVNYRYAALAVPFSEQGTTSAGIRIGNNVWIGANCTILDGAVIGDNTIVVANSLVNRQFPPNVIIQGNPAKVLMQRHAAVF